MGADVPAHCVAHVDLLHNQGRAHAVHTGSCLCGRVRYEYDGNIDEVAMCHCKQCQKAHGTAFAAVAPVRSAAFRITEGAEHLREFQSSPNKVRAFCSACGSPLYSARSDLPDVTRLRLGTLDTPVSANNRYHLWVSSRASWFDLTDELPKHAEFPDT